MKFKKFRDGFGWHIKGREYGTGVRLQMWVKGLIGIQCQGDGVNIGLWWGVRISTVWIHPNIFQPENT
jgi:hypothetical protein